jgi:membrane-bound lytic murein transglycosylase B
MIAAALSFPPVGEAIAATDQPFDAWLQDLRKDALAAGISKATLDEATRGLEPIPRVIELDRAQPEGRFTYVGYRDRVLAEARISQGRRLLKEHRVLLERVAADYGVQPRFIVALWGVETSYGQFTGGHSVVAALATLAHEGRRADFFRSELINALKILDQGHIGAAEMRGSWAGAMGQSQFMPSSFLRFAVDYDKDGRRDIWGSLPDVFASIANYLAKSGWNDRYTWGRPVRLASYDGGGAAGLEEVRPLPEWQSLGIRRDNGRDLPLVPLDASLVQTDDGQGPAYLVYKNFRVLMIWNRSTYFALTVGQLSDLISQG